MPSAASTNNIITRNLAAGARQIPQSIAPALAVTGALALAPEAITATALGSLAVAGTGAVAGAIPAGMSQGQESYEKVLKAQREAGVPENIAQTNAKKAGRISGAIETGGEAVGGVVAGRLLGVAGKTGRNLIAKSLKKDVASKLESSTLGRLGLGYAEALGTEVPTEMLQGGGETAVERAYGVREKTADGKDLTPGQAAIDAIGPTIGMTTLMAPFGIAGHHKAAKETRALLAAKIDEGKADRVALAATGSATPRADALIRSFTAGPGTSAILAGIPDPIADSENFPGATAELVARRQAAQARNAAAFDASNPVIPNAPENNYIPQVIPELGPPPAEPTLDLGNIGLPAAAPVEQSPYAVLDGTTRQHEVSRRRTSDPDGWLQAMTTAGNEIGNTPANAKAIVVRALDLHDAGQAAARQQATGPDYTQLTPAESDQLYQERYAADPDGWTQAMNSRGNINNGGDAHANRVSALARHDEIVAAQQTQQTQTRNEIYSAWADRVSTDPASRQLYHNAAQEVASAMAVEGHDVNGPLDQLDQTIRDDFQNRVQRRMAQMEREQGGDTDGQMHNQGATPQEVAPLLQDPTTGAPVSFGGQDQYDAMDYQQLGQEAVRRATGENANAWDAAMNQIEAEAPLSMRREDRYRLAMREHDARVAAAAPSAPTTAAWMTNENITLALTRDEVTSREALRDVLGTTRWNELHNAVREEANAAHPDLSVSNYAIQREAIRRAEAEVTSRPGAPDQYTNMDYTSLVATLDSRTDVAMANSCYAYAFDNSPNLPTLSHEAVRADIYREALREYDFRQANPVAQAPTAVAPSWSDNNDSLSTEDETRRAQLRDTQSQTYQDLYNEVGGELVAAAVNPARQENAVYREMLRRYDAYSTQPVDGTSDTMTTRRATDGTFMVIDSNGDVVNQGFGTRGDAYNFAQREFASTITSTPVPGTHTLPTPNPNLSVLEQNAPDWGDEVVARASSFSTPRAFMEWLYGDNVNAPSVAGGLANDMYGGSLYDRISRMSSWPDSPAKQRLLNVLEELRDQGFQTLREVHEGFDPSTRPAPPAAPTQPTPYRPEPVQPEPASHTEAVRAIVTAPLTTTETNRVSDLKSLAKKLTRALSDRPDTLSPGERTAWKGAFERVFTAVARKVERFRYGTSTAQTIQGIVADLNAHQRSIGSDLEIKAVDSSDRPTDALQGEVYIKVRRGNGQWFDSINAHGFNGAGTYAASGYSHDARIQGRYASDGGYGYYLQHLINRNVPGAHTASGGMYRVNQLRRLENALSFMARYGVAQPLNAQINSETGSGNSQERFNITGGESAMTAVAARAYNRIMNIYPQLARYTFNFGDGTVRAGGINGDIIPISAIVGHSRSARDHNGVANRTTMYEAQRHVSEPHNHEWHGHSEATFLRALITHEILRTKTESRVASPATIKPKPEKINAILNGRAATATRAAIKGIEQNTGFTDVIFYNRTEGVATKSNLQAPAIQKALVPITEALKGFVPVEVIQTMSHLPGYHEGMPSFNAAYHNGSIYVVADQVTSVAEAKSLVLDHELRHAGLRQVLGKGMDTFLKQAWYAKTAEIQAFANGKGIDTSTVEGRLEAAEEFVVSLAKEAKNHPLLDRAIAKIRSLLRALGFDLNLSRSEMRAMVAKAGEMKSFKAAQTSDATRFNRVTDAIHSMTAAATHVNMNELGANTVSGFKKGTNWMAQKLMPIDRLITRAIKQVEYKFLIPTLKAYESLREQKQSVADSIASAGVKQYNKMREKADTPEKWALVNGVLRDGRLWGMFPEKELTDQPWTTEGWAAKLRGETGKSLHAAHADLHERYLEMERLGMSQEYMNTRKSMEENHARMKRETMGLIDKVTLPTDAATVTRFTDVNGKMHTVVQDSTTMGWELRNKDNALVRTATTREGVLAGMTPYGKREEMKAKLEAQFQTVKGAYAPLSRFGDIVLQVFKPTIAQDGTSGEDRVARFHFETEHDYRAAREAIAAENPDYRLERSDKSQVKSSTRAGVPLEFMGAIDESVSRLDLDEATANELKDAFERVWIQLSPESNAMKHSLKGKNLAGFDEDMMRGFQAYTNQMGQSIASITHGIPLKQAFKDMETAIKTEEARGEVNGAREGRALVDHLRNHANVVANDRVNPAIAQLKKITSVWFLASPSVLLVQSAQPFVQALPNLAVKFGYTKSFTAISKAYREQMSIKHAAFSNDQLDRYMPTADKIIERRMAGLPFADLLECLDAKEQLLLGMAIETNRGGIDITLSHEGRAIADGKTKNWTDTATEKAMWAMKVSEIMSRKATFAAAFRLEMENHGDFTKAIDGAHETVKTALFDYAHSNRPAWLLGNAGSTLFQFQIFRAHTLSRLYQLTMDSLDKGQSARDARKELGYMLMNTMLISGMTGLPLPTALISAFVGLYGLGSGDDEPWDFDQWMRSMVGDGMTGDVMTKGLGALFGVDIARRVGMDGLFDLFNGEPQANATPTQQFEYYAGKLLGPAGSIAKDVAFKLPDMVKNGQWGDIVRQTTPKPLKDLVKAYDIQFGEGVYSGSGKLLVDSTDLNVWDMTLALVGVNPMSLSKAQTENFTAQKLLGSTNAKRTAIMKDFQRAVVKQDVDGIDAAIEARNKFNSQMPQLAITSQHLAEGVKQAVRKEMGIEDKNLEKVKQMYGIGE